MKLLIAGSSSKFFHLQEFGNALVRQGSQFELVHDVEIVDGFPSRKISNWFQSKKKFNNLIKNFAPDAVFIDRQGHFGVSTIEAKIPLLVHLRGDYWSEIKWARETLYKDPVKRNVLRFKNKLAEKCFKDSQMILPICSYLKDIVDEKFPNKSNVMYQGIDSSRWYPTEGMKLKHPCVGILQSATIWGKTQEMLTLVNVLKNFPNVMFYWVGDGVYKDKILPVLSKFENFKWLGSLEYPNRVREYLSEIDVYLLISGIDMSPLTLLEAQLMEKPVIATKVGGIPELMMNEKTGFLVEKGNSVEIIEKISLLLDDEKKIKIMGNNGRKFIIENFSWDKIAKDFLKKTKDVIE